MPKKTREQKKRIRVKNLWTESPYCRRCNCLTVLKGDNVNQINLATLEHIYSRFHPKRKVITPGEQRTTLLCWQCNQDKAQEDLKEFHIFHKIKSRKALTSLGWLKELAIDIDNCFLK